MHCNFLSNSSNATIVLCYRIRGSGAEAGQVRSSNSASEHKDSCGLAKCLRSCTLHSPTIKAVTALCLPDTIL